MFSEARFSVTLSSEQIDVFKDDASVKDIRCGIWYASETLVHTKLQQQTIDSFPYFHVL